MGTRYITPFGTLMTHKARGSLSGEFPGQLDSRYSYYLKRLNKLDEIVVSRTNGKLTMQQYKQLYENEFWINGFETVNFGLADKMVVVRCARDLQTSYVESKKNILFEVNIYWSNCPMITVPLKVVVNVFTGQGTVDLDTFQKSGIKFFTEQQVTQIIADITTTVNTMISKKFDRIPVPEVTTKR